MKKKMFGIVLILIILTSSISIGTKITNKESSIMDYIEIIDQQQPISNGRFFFNGYQAQSFKPTLNNLSKIEVCVRKFGEPEGNLTFSIRKNLNDVDLTLIDIPLYTIPSDPFVDSWIEFDFPGIDTIPEDVYYIIFNFDAEYKWNYENHIRWTNYGYINSDDAYERGIPYICYGYHGVGNWKESNTLFPDMDKEDFCFKTYGFNDNPNLPDVNGLDKGKINEQYEIYVNISDPNGHLVSFYIDWGDERYDNWSDFYESGSSHVINHMYNESDDYIIKVKARDNYGAESDWATLEVSMPKSKSINTPLFLQRFFRCFSFFEKILNQYYY